MNLLLFLSLLFISTRDVTAQDSPSEIKDFTANTQYNISVDAGVFVEFVCEIIPGSPVGDVMLEMPDGSRKPFDKMYIPSNGSVILWEGKNLSCADGGTYKCLLFPDETNQAEPTHKDVVVNVTCPVNFPKGTPTKIWVETDNPVISIPFFGLPDPSDVKLSKVEGDKTKPVSISFKIKREKSKDEGEIIIAIHKEDPEGVEGSYVLLASNAVQKGVPAELAFEIEKVPEHFEIRDFRANRLYNLTVEEGTKVEFVCNVIPGKKSGKVDFEMPDGGQKMFDKMHIASNDSILFWESMELSCAAGGTYKCVITPDGTDQANVTHKDVIVNVTCPVGYPQGTPNKFQVDSDYPTISIPFVGRPDPSDVELYKVNGEARKQVPIHFKITRNDPTDEGDIIIYIPEDISEVEGSYVLIASNTVQKGHPAELKFQITKKPREDPGEKSGLAAGLGVGVALVVVIGVCIVVGVVYMRKRRTNYNPL